MTCTKTAIWNLLKRDWRGALRVSLLGQSLLLLAAACGGGEPAEGGNTTTGMSTPSSVATPGGGTAAAGTSGAKPGGMTTPAGGSNTAAGGAKPAGGTMTTTPPAGGSTPAAMGGAAGAPVASGGTTPSGSAAAGTSGGSGTTGGMAAAAGASGGAQSPDSGSTPSGSDDLTGESKCLADVTSGFDKEGPFKVMQMREGSVNFWVPMVPEGCKVPIVHLANGTGASCSSYGQALQRFGTHGFLTCCYENPNTGAGTQGVEAFKAAMTKFPNLAAKRYGSTGHSQGGQASFVVQALAEKEFGLDGNKFAGLAMQPASGFGSQPAGSWQMQYKSIKSPMFMFSGQGSDGLVSQGWVMDAFNNLDKGIEAYFWAKAGGMHIPTPQGEEMQLGPAWFRWKLLGDKNACKFFKSIPMMDSTWEVVAEQNQAECD